MSGMGDHAEPLRAMSLEEWAALDEDEPGELVDGLLEEEEVPSYLHELVVSWLIRSLGAWVVPRGGFVFGSEAKIAVGPRRGRKPDVVLWLPGSTRPAANDSIARTPPDLVVEVITPTPRDGRRDRVEKKNDYAAAGVGQYWIVDPSLRTLEILVRNADGRFVDELAASEGAHPAPGLEGLVIDLDALWAEADRLG